jgi:hypothetical protein
LNIYALQNTAKEGATNKERMNNPHTPTPEAVQKTTKIIELL